MGSPMSHVDFKKWQSRMFMSLISPMSHVEYMERVCPMSLSPMSHVEFKKCQSCPVDFKGSRPDVNAGGI